MIEISDSWYSSVLCLFIRSIRTTVLMIFDLFCSAVWILRMCELCPFFRTNRLFVVHVSTVFFIVQYKQQQD